jgi:hypothetical protein
LTAGISRAGWWTHNLACRLLCNCTFRKGRVQLDGWHFHEPAGGPTTLLADCCTIVRSGRDQSSLTGGISRAGWWTYNLACRLLYNCLFRKGRVQFDGWHFTSRLVDPQPCRQIAVQLSVSGRDESSLTAGISRAGWWTHNLACRLLCNCTFQEGTCPV